jgi:phage shock protein C
MNTQTTPKRLYLSNDDKKLLGVCGGIAEYFNIDPTVIRLGWVVATIASGVVPGIIAYLVAAMVMPKTPK